VLVSIVILALCAGKLAAQVDSIATTALSDSALSKALSDTISLLGTDRYSELSVPERVPVGPIRLASASAGSMFGAVLGGFAGSQMRDRDCKTDCRKLTGEALLRGAAIGAVLGAAVGAAFLDIRSVCRFDKRLARTIIGSTVGASALFVASGGLRERNGVSPFFLPIGAISGSMGSLGRCWKSHS
jgi:hypothetical protein